MVPLDRRPQCHLELNRRRAEPLGESEASAHRRGTQPIGRVI